MTNSLPGFWSAVVMIAAVVLLSTAGEVLTAAAMKSIGDLDDIRAHSGLKGAIRAVVTCPLFFAGVGFLALAFFSLLFALNHLNLSLVAPAAASLTLGIKPAFLANSSELNAQSLRIRKSSSRPRLASSEANRLGRQMPDSRRALHRRRPSGRRPVARPESSWPRRNSGGPRGIDPRRHAEGGAHFLHQRNLLQLRLFHAREKLRQFAQRLAMASSAAAAAKARVALTTSSM
jgi:hypothetical protein